MQKKITIRLLPSEAADESAIRERIVKDLGIPEKELTGYQLVKRSLDARGKQAYFQMTLIAFVNEPFRSSLGYTPSFQQLKNGCREVIIAGAGPAGLFAALRLLEMGIRPIIIERGKDVRARRRDLAAMNKEGLVDPESNYCFGEGGAGTYSDGKLYTRSNKRGNVQRILDIFIHFGAEEKKGYESHPHIGTNKLPQIITAMRKAIVEHGGQVLFEKKLVDIVLTNNKVTEVVTADGDRLRADALILATGHSARDIFRLLQQKQLSIYFKPFALGVRVEHPQTLIDAAQYHCSVRDALPPPAAYSLVHQAGGKGVFSFCMCPGGIIAPAATSPGEIVVNGWSPSKRNNPFANSGIVVNVEEADVIRALRLKNVEQLSPLDGMEFQSMVERKAFEAGGGGLVAPAQRLTDFVNGNISSSLPDCSYLPGIRSSDLGEVFPSFVHRALVEGFQAFGKKIRNFLTQEAVVVATESRTSSPVRIPRETDLRHPQVENLFPCAEGAGYAGGIVSAAMDGEKVAEAVAARVR